MISVKLRPLDCFCETPWTLSPLGILGSPPLTELFTPGTPDVIPLHGTWGNPKQLPMSSQ